MIVLGSEAKREDMANEAILALCLELYDNYSSI